MANKVVTTDSFATDLNRLAKKHPSLLGEIENLITQLAQNAFLGDSIGGSGGVRKIRIAEYKQGNWQKWWF